MSGKQNYKFALSVGLIWREICRRSVDQFHVLVRETARDAPFTATLTSTVCIVAGLALAANYYPSLTCFHGSFTYLGLPFPL